MATRRLFTSCCLYLYFLLFSVSTALAEYTERYYNPAVRPTRQSFFYAIILSSYGGLLLLMVGVTGVFLLMSGGQSRSKDKVVIGSVMVGTMLVLFIYRAFISSGVVQTLEMREINRMSN